MADFRTYGWRRRNHIQIKRRIYALFKRRSQGTTNALMTLVEAASPYDPSKQPQPPPAKRSRKKKDEDGLPVASYVDDDVMLELCWDQKTHGAAFIKFDRKSGQRLSVSSHQACGIELVPPRICQGIITPGPQVSGNVLVPTGADFDTANIRKDITEFLHRYVELPGDAFRIAVEYVLLSWVYDRFDELPYVAFKTADIGRGKSRALETVGALCRLAMFAGGGSSAAATLRLLDVFQGTLVADEFDKAHNTELATDLNRILNQGFQRRRPLLKCDGDRNEPQPFYCFGPKLFACREGFGDDATASRTIAIKMEQRTRKDIPISLPRGRFDLEALALRNKLVAWRFQNYDQVKVKPELADPSLEDRLNQIGLPLMSIAPDNDTRKRIIAALKDQQEAVADSRGETVAGQVVEVLLGMGDPGGQGLEARPKEVAAAINQRWALEEGVEVEDLRRPISSHKVGKLMGSVLELQKLVKDSQGAKYLLTSKRRAQLAQRYGVPPGNVTNVITALVTETPLEETQVDQQLVTPNDDCDVSDVAGGTVTFGDVPDPEAVRTVPDGWTTDGWMNHLRNVAEACEDLHPDKAQQYRREADELDASV